MSPKRHIKRPKSAWRKKARKGFQGYPIATVAYYGPDDKFASKVAVGIILREQDKETADLKRWFSDGLDVRFDPSITQEITEFIESYNVRSVGIADRIIGCPHEEGKDYPKGETCPECPFWVGRDRWTGELFQ